jgi:hypothetical protein
MRVVIRTSFAILAAAGVAACSESTAPAAGHLVSVSFATSTTSSPTASRIVDPSASTSEDAAADNLVITKAQLVLARMELVKAGATCTTETAAGDDDVGGDDDQECAELELAPSLVELPVNGTVATTLDVTVPEGSYSSLEAKLRPIRTSGDHGRASSAFLAAHPEASGVSVLVDGTFNGVPFSYRGDVSVGIEQSFSPPLAVTTAPINLTVNVDLATWFRTRTGTAIDPATANAGGANATLVADNIKRSFHAFRDDDRDGHDDGEGHH